MSFREELTDVTGWFRGLSAASKNWLKVGMVLVVLVVSGGFSSCLAPAAAVLVWTLLSTETRTMPISVLMLLGLVGAFVLLPAVAFLETPFQWWTRADSIWPQAVAAAIELLAITAALVALSLVPVSRFRISATIVDFMIAGVWLGAGLEAGIAFMNVTGPFCLGKEWGWWPLFPGLMGSADFSNACASPITAGLLAGWFIGLLRYLAGPNFGSRVFQGYVLTLLAGLMLWMGLERVGFLAHDFSGVAGVLYDLDLKGRLLAYVVVLTGVATLLTEGLLLREKPQAKGFPRGRNVFLKNWRASRGNSWTYRIAQLMALQARRMRQRELLLAGEMKPFLQGSDLRLLEQRLVAIGKTLEAAQPLAGETSAGSGIPPQPR